MVLTSYLKSACRRYYPALLEQFLIYLQSFIDRLKTFLAKFNQLDLCKDEFILINLAVLFSSDRVGLFNTNKINHYQELGSALVINDNLSLNTLSLRLPNPVDKERYTTILEKTMNLPEAKAKYNKNRLPVS